MNDWGKRRRGERWVENGADGTDETDESMRLNSPIDSSVARGCDDGLLVSRGCPMGQSRGSDVSSGLRKVGLDPVTSSVPFVATFVDVTGITIYFPVARVTLQGTLL
jgi:hypothetical protein